MLIDFDILDKVKKEQSEKDKQRKLEEVNKWEQEMIIKGIDPHKYNKKSKHYGNCDSVYTMENSTATVLWIFIMIGGSIFIDRWIIWIVATVIWRKFMTRHTMKEKDV